MEPNEYQQLALRTEKGLKDKELELDAPTGRLMHAAVGLCTETGELQDALKKKLFYDRTREIDRTNIIEEFGDILWYVAVGLDAVGATIEEAMEKNIAKLKARYPDGFTSADALNRDHEAERAALEKVTPQPLQEAQPNPLEVQATLSIRDPYTKEVTTMDVTLVDAQVSQSREIQRRFDVGSSKSELEPVPRSEWFTLQGRPVKTHVS